MGAKPPANVGYNTDMSDSQASLFGGSGSTASAMVPLAELSHGQESDFFALLTAREELTTKDGKPYFHDHCTSCFACIQWCPKQAIHNGDYSFEELDLKPYHNSQNLVQKILIYALRISILAQ